MYIIKNKLLTTKDTIMIGVVRRGLPDYFLNHNLEEQSVNFSKFNYKPCA